MEALKYILPIFLGILFAKAEMFDIEAIKCKLEDSKCMTASIQKAVPYFAVGIPEIGVETLDTMEIEKIKFDLSGLQFSLAGGRLKGLKHAHIESVKWDTEKRSIEVIYHFNGSLVGHYTASGRILILPISGDGQMKLKFKDMMIKFILDYVLKNREGKDFIDLTKYSFTFDILGNANYHLANLFNGNKELSNAMHMFLNDNWKQVSSEFGTPIIQKAADKIFKNVNTFFTAYPVSEIAYS